MNNRDNNKNTNSPAAFYIVSTPIGNLEDITLRALNTLKSVDQIVAEDTRHTRKLLSHYSIKKKVISFHDHTSSAKIDRIIKKLIGGESIAYVTDAGTPGIADPGFVLIRAMIEHDFPVVPIPGVAAAITALTGSGLPMDRFVFEGFLPFKSGKRQTRLRALVNDPRTIILYESPHRLGKCLNDIHEILGNRQICICRELTKIFEEFIRGSVLEVAEHFKARPPRGEITIILAGANK